MFKNPFASPSSPASIPTSWDGWYAYDLHESIDVELLPVSFSMWWEFNWFGRFTGAVQDGPESDMQEIGTIKGRVRKTTIEFTKYMPVGTILNPDGTSSKTSTRHPPIQYFGDFDAIEMRLAGKWYILTNYTECSGAWEATPSD
ncbi:hypothetical protein [Mariniblastus fucicola]|nr:hypothetical protein [Mariniblastus fucicola]